MAELKEGERRREKRGWRGFARIAVDRKLHRQKNGDQRGDRKELKAHRDSNHGFHG